METSARKLLKLDTWTEVVVTKLLVVNQIWTVVWEMGRNMSGISIRGIGIRVKWLVF